MKKTAGLDSHTLELVRLSAAVAQGYEPELRERVDDVRSAGVPATWVDEVLLQSVLFVGYPRTLVAFGLWRKASGEDAPATDPDVDYARAPEWLARGEETCSIIYGDNYRKLRNNVKQLHPALDAWMIAEGYGRTLSRPGLDLMRRELCIVAQAGVLETPRQLHSHLRGALKAGASFGQVEGVLAVMNPLLSFDSWKRVKEMWRAVREAWVPGD
ncbi:MAG TPA: carboxymuconolactone decarboxylase family protein [Gemmatimonadales bacterium]|nr:carboxymuconolactone decarboxylase family protein [Gemmatimonadales bacterium]